MQNLCGSFMVRFFYLHQIQFRLFNWVDVTHDDIVIAISTFRMAKKEPNFEDIEEKRWTCWIIVNDCIMFFHITFTDGKTDIIMHVDFMICNDNKSMLCPSLLVVLPFTPFELIFCLFDNPANFYLEFNEILSNKFNHELWNCNSIIIAALNFHSK